MDQDRSITFAAQSWRTDRAGQNEDGNDRLSAWCSWVEVADIDNNGKPDFVVAFGQEFESTELYLNQGSGNFERQILHVLPDPSYNSSSFQIVDVDQDGKLDVVHTCGDTMDAYIAKPYHGLRWFRNQGERRWENRELGLLVGALQSTVADFDGDGDMDIAGVGMFPKANQDGPGRMIRSVGGNSEPI